MDQTQQKAVAVTEQLNLRTVDFFINAQLISIAGNWVWDMHSEAVYCSDVIMGMPPNYVGTKGIIHPEDIEHIGQQLLSLKQEEPVDINFRLITTYNEVKNVSGKNCLQVQVNELKLQPPVQEFFTSTAIQKEVEKGFENFHTVKDTVDFAEKLTRTATWFSNTNTGETYYSDNVFRLHAITPQSLNPHLNTFNHFIHPDDALAVNDAFDAGYKNAVPIFIEYRIITANGTEKVISLTTSWSHNFKGQLILNGLLQDLTNTKSIAQKIEQAENDVQFQKALLQFHEQAGSTGYWQLNLLTKQTFYSDNYYRIHGIKPQSIPASVNIFTNYIHPDDREKVIEAFKKIRKEHVAPDLEYCILRADGKVRYVVQKGQMMQYGDELIMTGTIRDITALKVAEQKLKEQNEIAALKQIAHQETEQAAGVSSWAHDINANTYWWSENMYGFLGFRNNVKELTFAQLLKSVLTEDRKTFTDEIAMATENGPRSHEFSILRNGEVRKIKGVFKLVNIEGKRVFTGTLQDVTSNRLLEQQLFEGSQLNQLLIQNIVDSVFITDINNRIVLWNRKCEQVLQLKMDDVLERNYFDVFPGRKTEMEINRFNSVLKGEIIHEPNERLFGKEFYDLNMLPLRDKDNNVMGILHVLHDVTGEVLLRDSLNQRLNFIEKLLEETVDRIIVVDRNLNCRYWNKKAEQDYRINKEYTVGKNLLQVFPSLINSSFYGAIKTALKGENIHIPSNQDVVDKSRFSETYLVPLLSERKEVTDVLWIAHDLTEVKRAEREVLQLKDTLAEQVTDKNLSLFNSIEQGFCTIGLKYDEYGKAIDYQFIEVNPSFESQTGIKDAAGKWMTDIAAQQDELWFQIYGRVAKSRKDERFEYFSPPLGRWWNVYAFPIDDPELHRIGVLFYDITESKKAEETFRASYEADTILLQKKDEFISVASHELKSPITSLKMSLHILGDLLGKSEENKKLRQFIKKTDKQADNLTDLLDTLMDSTQINEGKLNIRRSKFVLQEAIAEVMEALFAQMKDCKIQMKGNTDLEVYADKIRIQQVITNYVTNAVKYSPAEKDVTVHIERQDELVKVSVTDKGIGIPGDNLDKVFDKYFRVEEISQQYAGLGLGLYISKEIIKKHGGEVGVMSSKGSGSTFWFSLPVKK